MLAINVVPAYSKMGAEESWPPNVIPAQWTSARIVGSAETYMGQPLSSLGSKTIFTFMSYAPAWGD
ncbi:MAG: hypothetical protein ACE15F_03410 [bacterium]